MAKIKQKDPLYFVKDFRFSRNAGLAVQCSGRRCGCEGRRWKWHCCGSGSALLSKQMSGTTLIGISIHLEYGIRLMVFFVGKNARVSP